MASEGKEMLALDRVIYHFHYDRRERRIFTHYLLVTNNKEHGPHSEEAVVLLEWQDVETKNYKKSVRSL